MSEPSKKRPRITEDLHTLGKIIHKPNTPQARTAVAPTASGGRIFVRTPASAAARTPIASASARAVPRRGQPTTPHAIRALQQRRNAALTPGGGRRRSGRVQRETPRNDLRQLSRVLAKSTRPAELSPQPSVPRRHSRSILQDRDESPALQQPPRLSMALGDLDDDSFHENPPRLSYNLDQEDDGFENSRRAMLNAGDRRSLGSFGDPSFADLNELGMGDHEEREARRIALEEQEMMYEDDMDELDADGETGELRALMESRRQSGRSEDIGPSSSPGTTGEPTFLFRIPERSRNSLLRPDEEVKDEIEAEAEGEVLTEAHVDMGAEDGADFEDVLSEEEEEEVAAPLRGESPAPADAGPQEQANKAAKRARKEFKVSRFGIEYPSLPPTVIKRLASTFARSYGGSGKLNKETIAAISQTSDWFFEQVSEDLTSYADHAGRKTIEEADVVTIMKRQRQLNNSTTPFSLAQKFLPRELLQEVKMVPPAGKSKKRKRPRMQTIEEENEE